MYVLDATPLIYLGKAERLGLLAELDRDCVTPERVSEEVVVAGVDGGHADARRVERAVEEGTVRTLAVETTDAFRRLRGNDSLSEADAAVLSLADARDATAVIDEQYGRAVADAEGIRTRGTAYLVLRLATDGTVTSREARRTVDAMVEAGWYCSPDLYASVVRKLDSMS